MRRWAEIAVRKSDEQLKGPVENRTKVCHIDPSCRLPQRQCITYAQEQTNRSGNVVSWASPVRQVLTVRTRPESRTLGAPEVRSGLEF